MSRDLQIDFGRTADDYARHRAGFPSSLFEELDEYEIGRPGQRVVDLGTGTGSMARGLARKGCRVIGVDIAPEMLAEARRLDGESGVAVEYREGPAEATGLPATAFDVVTAGQCWHWFDRGRAAAEALRLLTGGGRIVIAHFDWLPLPGNVVAATEELILTHNPRWSMAGGTGLYPTWPGDLAAAGFGDIRTFSFDEDVMYSHEGWRGRIRASAGIAAALDSKSVAVFDRELELLLRRDFPNEPLTVPHRVFAVLAKKPVQEHSGDRAG